MLTAWENWDLTEVVNGLEEGELIVISVGREGVVHGAKAVVEEDDS